MLVVSVFSFFIFYLFIDAEFTLKGLIFGLFFYLFLLGLPMGVLLFFAVIRLKRRRIIINDSGISFGRIFHEWKSAQKIVFEKDNLRWGGTPVLTVYFNENGKAASKMRLFSIYDDFALLKEEIASRLYGTNAVEDAASVNDAIIQDTSAEGMVAKLALLQNLDYQDASAKVNDMERWNAVVKGEMTVKDYNKPSWRKIIISDLFIAAIFLSILVAGILSDKLGLILFSIIPGVVFVFVIFIQYLAIKSALKIKMINRHTADLSKMYEENKPVGEIAGFLARVEGLSEKKASSIAEAYLKARREHEANMAKLAQLRPNIEKLIIQGEPTVAIALRFADIPLPQNLVISYIETVRTEMAAKKPEFSE